MECLFLEYPKCSTCQKARKWLIENGVTHISRHIVEQNPDIEELKRWCLRSGQPLKKFFNTSGMVYKQLNLRWLSPRPLFLSALSPHNGNF